MKKIVSVVLILVLVLSVGTMAFADSNAVNITKNPTDEVRFVGDNAIFTVAATGYSKFAWNFQSPDGKTYTVQDFRNMFPYAHVEGEDTATLTVKNVSTAMNGWAVYCAFFSGNTEFDTTLAYLYVTVYNPATDTAPKTYTTTYYTYTLLYSDDYGYYYYIPEDEDVVLYVNEYGTYTPAHPDAYDKDDVVLYADEYGTYTPAHPDAYDDDDEVQYVDSYTTYFDDGSSVTDYQDGSYAVDSNDGYVTYYDMDGNSLESHEDGSYLQSFTNGYWNAYNASTGEFSGGMDY